VLFPYIRAACRLESYLEAVGDFARRWAALRSCDFPNPVPTITSTPAPSTDSNPTSGERNTAPCPSSTTGDADLLFASAFANSAENRLRGSYVAADRTDPATSPAPTPTAPRALAAPRTFDSGDLHARPGFGPAIMLPRSPRPLPALRSSDGAVFKFEHDDSDDLDGSETAAAGNPRLLPEPGWDPSLRRADSDSSWVSMSAARQFPFGWGLDLWADSDRLGPVDSDRDAAPPAWLGPRDNAPHSDVGGGGGADSGLRSCGDVFIIGGGWASPAGSGLFTPPPLLRQAAETFGPSALAAELNARQRVDCSPSGPAGPHPTAAAACFSHYSAL
jgi:hypothetical protein